MSDVFDLVLRHVHLPGGRVADVGVADGKFAHIAASLGRSHNDFDCNGRLLVPGLHDHHIHLLATAAQQQSVDLSGCTDTDGIVASLKAKARETPAGKWIRAIGYDERAAGIPDRDVLDTWLGHCPLRVQDRTGALWILNGAALALTGEGPWPEAVETDASGRPTGRIWRGDDWLRSRIGGQPPSLAPLSQQLARWGVTAVTDAGANNGRDEASILSAALRSGQLRQRLTIMGREDLPGGDCYQLGAVKLLFDERALPEIGSIVSRIRTARALGRSVAAHCVTEGELLTYLAALEQAGGARAGDRIEHGSMIAHSLIADIALARLTVVTNPGLIARRGDRYLAEIDAVELPNLQRLSSLSANGVPLLAGSDAPYGPANPWVAIRAAMLRQTALGTVLGASEAVSSDAALALFTSKGSIQAGTVADCCLIPCDWASIMCDDENPNPVQFTLFGGQLA